MYSFTLQVDACTFWYKTQGSHCTFHRKLKTEQFIFSAHNYKTKTNYKTHCAVFRLNMFFSQRRLDIGLQLNQDSN